jgi:RNA-directed DNA polymerase
MPNLQKWVFKPRTYKHLDCPISEQKAISLVTNPDKVAKHSFRPFLSMTVSTPRYKKDIHKVQPKDRPIRYAAHADSAIYSYYAYLLTNAYEIFLKDKIYESPILAYRKLGKSNINFAKEAFQTIDRIAERDNHCLAIAIDIKSFFDTLDHDILKSAWSEVINEKKLPDDHYAVFKNITNFSWFEKEELEKLILNQTGAAINWEDRQTPICTNQEMREWIKNTTIYKKAKDQLDYSTPNRRGIPQGSPISAILANLYMSYFDQKIKEEVQIINGEYYRYADDILLLIPPEHSTIMLGGLMRYWEKIIAKPS